MKISWITIKSENEVRKTLNIEVERFLDGFEKFQILVFTSSLLFLIPYLIHLGWLLAEIQK